MASAPVASAGTTAATMTTVAATSTAAASASAAASATASAAGTPATGRKGWPIRTLAATSVRRSFTVKVRLGLVGEIAAAFDGQGRRVCRSFGVAVAFTAAVLWYRSSAHLGALLLEDGLA